MGRSAAREEVLQALYQHELGIERADTQATQQAAVSGDHDPTQDYGQDSTQDYGLALLDTIVQCLSQLDEALQPWLNQPLATLDPVTRSLLRIGACELLYRPEVDYKVAIDEAVRLSRRFGSDRGFALVNAVLHQLSLRVRSDEHISSDE